MYSNRSFTLPARCQTWGRESVPRLPVARSCDMSPALGAPTAQRRQTTLRFEGRLGLSGLPPPEFGSPTGGLSPCHGSQALCRPERRLRGLPAIGPLASAKRSPWLQELIRHYTRIYCCLPHLKIETRRYTTPSRVCRLGLALSHSPWTVSLSGTPDGPAAPARTRTSRYAPRAARAWTLRSRTHLSFGP